jgi:hypothetical protein
MINLQYFFYCAAEAVFCYTAANSHHLKAQVTPKKSAVPRGEDIRKKKGKKSNNYGEIIEKLNFFVWCIARQRAIHATLHLYSSRYRTRGRQSANFMCEIYSPESLEGRRGEGAVICETVPFVNGSSDRLQIQNEDSQYHSASLLFRQDSPNSYWWLLASFGKFI